MPTWSSISRQNLISLTKRWGMHSWDGQIREILTGIIPTLQVGKWYPPHEENWVAASAFVMNDGLLDPPADQILACDIANPAVDRDVLLHRVEANLFWDVPPLAMQNSPFQLMCFTPTYDSSIGGALYDPTAQNKTEHGPGLTSGISGGLDSGQAPPQSAAQVTSGYQDAFNVDLGGNVVQGTIQQQSALMSASASPGTNTQNTPIRVFQSAELPPYVIKTNRSVAVQVRYPRGSSDRLRLTANFYWSTRAAV